MKYSFFICLYGALFFGLIGCKSKKTIATTPTVSNIEKTPNTANEFLSAIESRTYTPEWFSGRGNINATLGTNSMEVDAVIQIRKDSAILLVVKKFGFEGARALITKDSVFLINRLEQTYDKQAITALTQRFNLPAQFDALQQLILGNPARLDSKPYEVMQQDTTVLLQSSLGKLSADYAFAKKTLKLNQAFFEDEESTSKMTMQYGNYKMTAVKKEFSCQRNIEFFSPQGNNGEIDIEFKEVEFNVAKAMRFQIPNNYKRKNYLNP